MARPANVQRQIDTANAAIEAAAKGNTGEPAPAVQSEQSAAPAAVTLVPAAPDPLGLKPDTNAELDKAKKDLAASEQRFNVLQGKYNAEVPRLSDQVRELTEKVNEFASKASQAPAEKLVTDKDATQFGDDMIDMVRRVAREEVDPLQKQIGTVKSTVETTAKTAQRTQMQQYWDDVDALLAAKSLTFEAMNNDPAFIAWLAEKDGLSGMARIDMLEKAQAELNAQRTAMFFTTYAQGLPKGDAAASLSEQIQPDIGSGGGDLSQSDKGRIWTGAQISQFYDDKRRGKYKGKEKEAASIEADILAAQREGRYRH